MGNYELRMGDELWVMSYGLWVRYTIFNKQAKIEN